ncbi:MAG: cyanophycin synthetase, partial [Candidatus Promineifilaceae bacterium]|nr:cyanophycin synthetase [Candidatus Promineifilaceae bacterium]
GRKILLIALGAIAVMPALVIPWGHISRPREELGGVRPRFQIVGEINDVIIIDDYAHHPTEIEATLAAARQQYPGRRLWAIWQPHTYSRTRLLQDRFATSFEDADRVVVLDIYRSRERDTLGIDSAQMVAGMAHRQAEYIGRREDAAAHLVDRVRPGDVLLTLGAGDGDLVGQWVLDGLKERERGG